MKKFIAAVLATLTCCMVALFVACTSEEDKKPEKLKDGIALTITEGESKTIDLSEYISIEGTEYAYTVNSSASGVATVSVDGNTATVTAVSKGSATVTASADEVSVSFAVTVNEKQQPEPEKVDKTALVAELALEVTSQGDYTSESYAAYTQKLQAAKAVNAKTDATQTEVNTACNELKTARQGLAVRVPEEVENAEKTLIVISGLSKEIDISDYIDAKNLSSVTYEASSANTLVTVGEIEAGKFTVTAGATEDDVDVTLTIYAKYKGESKLTVTLTLQVKSEAQPTVNKTQVTQSVDIYSLENKTALTIDFTQNVESNGVENLVYSVTSGGNPVLLDSNNSLTYNLDGIYSETSTDVVFNVSVAYGEEKSVSYTYTLKITDTTAYRVANGSFTNDLDGWTMDGEIGEISERSSFWPQNFPIFNEGKYFYGEVKENGTGTLTSSMFKVGGIKKITFKLGAAGNSECYITLEKTDGTVLAIWRNAKFEDVDNWSMEEIGKTQFACNLVTYVADLTAYTGQTLKIVLHDNAGSGFGFFNFDELITYYKSEADLPEGATAAVNELADKTQLQALVDGKLTDKGDYTDETYNAYTAKVAEAQPVLEKVSATQAEVDAAKAAIDTAYAALEVRTPAEKDTADKSISLLVNGSKELSISDYVDDKGLSSLTYDVTSADTKVTASISGDNLTVTAGNAEVEGVAVSLFVKYKGSKVLTVTISVTVTSETAPVLKETAVTTDIDLYSVENKTDITLDFSSNVENVGGLDLEYAVTLNDNTETLDGTSYTYTYESYTDKATPVVFAVRVSFTKDGTPDTISYNYTLNIKDTRAYRITNGGFDDGLDGWELSNNKLGGVNSDETYWNENIPFNNDGKFFNAYAEGCREEAKGTLTSSPFKIGGSGWITYKLGGGAKNADKVYADNVYLDIVENGTGNILARYYNNAFSDDVNSTTVRGCTLVAYKANLSALIGKTVYIRLVDGADSNYGLFFVDSFVTYDPEEPTSGTEATAVDHPATIYDIYNGGFESESNLIGWTVSGGEIGVVTSDKGYWNDGDHENGGTEYGKEGNKLFSWWTWEGNLKSDTENPGHENNREGNIGTLTSSMFVLKAGKYVSFKFGGGGNRNVFIELVNADSGSVIAVFRNDNFEDGKLKSYNYKADGLSKDTLCYFRVVDNATSGSWWGCFAADDFKVNLDLAPAGSFAADDHKGDYASMVNGSFEQGLNGWTKGWALDEHGNDVNPIGAVVSAEKSEGWYQTNETTKDGNNLFTFYYEKDGTYQNVEPNTGFLRSSAFILNKNGIISFRFGAAHRNDVYIDVYTTGGRLLARFLNNAYTQDTVMVQYCYQFDNSEEISCYFEVVDKANGGPYGCIVMDDFRVNLSEEPTGAVRGSAQTKEERFPTNQD